MFVYDDSSFLEDEMFCECCVREISEVYEVLILSVIFCESRRMRSKRFLVEACYMSLKHGLRELLMRSLILHAMIMEEVMMVGER